MCSACRSRSARSWPACPARLLTGYLKENSRVKEDTVMGIVFSGMFGLGLVIFTKVDTDQHLHPHPVRQRAGRDRARPGRDGRSSPAARWRSCC